MAVLSSSQAASKYGVPDSNPGMEFAKDAYAGPDSPAGYQAGNRQSTSFVFNSKDLSSGKPNAYSSDTRSTVYGGGGAQPGMGA